MDNMRRLGLAGAVVLVFGLNLSVASLLIGFFTSPPYLVVLFAAGLFIDVAGTVFLLLWGIIWLFLGAGKRNAEDVSE
jgi:hypothetical protein